MRGWMSRSALVGLASFVSLCVGACDGGSAAVWSDMITVPRAAYEEQISADRVDFVALDLATGRKLVLEGSQIYERHAPWSTFKIPNTLIGLQADACLQPDERLNWNAARWPSADFWPDAWRGDHDLESAFRNSVVWYYRQMAQCVGGETYRETLADWRYGNAMLDIGDDGFWLGRDLQISPWEQVLFLQQLQLGEVDISAEHLERLHAISLDQDDPDARLHGKTGAGARDGEGWEGWYVGYIRRDNQPGVVFALYARAQDYRDIRSFRRDFAIALLSDAGYLPD